MAQIVINEISQNYTYNIGTSSYACVAMPISSCWGPGFFDPKAEFPEEEAGDATQKMLERTVWQRFPATQAGLEAFVSAYRGPAANYRMAKDYSYQMALTLLTAGYDILACRICPGVKAEGTFTQVGVVNRKLNHKKGDPIPDTDPVEYYTSDEPADPDAVAKWNEDHTKVVAWKSDPTVTFKAKYPGTFGNNIQIAIKKMAYRDPAANYAVKYCWNIITYVIDASGVKTSVESRTLVFNTENSTESVQYYKEVTSNFWDIVNVDTSYKKIQETENCPNLVDADSTLDPKPIYKRLAGGNDYDTEKSDILDVSKITLKPMPDPNPDDTSEIDWNKNPANYTFEYSGSILDALEYRYDWATAYTQSTDGRYDKYGAAVRSCLNITPIEPEEEPTTAEAWKTYWEDITHWNVTSSISDDQLKILYWREWVFSYAVGGTSTDMYGDAVGGVYDLLKDKLTYNPQRVISPGWDDQDVYMYTDDYDILAQAYGLTGATTCKVPVSPLHLKIMDVAYYGRCATGFIDVPHIVDRRYVHIEDESDFTKEGYIQELARVIPVNAALDVNGSLFSTHCAFFAPWGQYTYVGTNKMNPASPSFQALMIQRAQILNQPTQYEWALPTNRKHNLRLGKLDYTVPKKLLDQWQKLEGASVNVITTIPDLGTNIWGNSTLFEVPPATYQALANLSTRYLVNAVEDVAYRCGISITFQYNNNQAYNKFYAGVTPLLDTMQNVGAIDGYRVEMSADINGEDHVNANSVIGKIWLIVNGVINDIYVDLIALPAGLGIDLNSLS